MKSMVYTLVLLFNNVHSVLEVSPPRQLVMSQTLLYIITDNDAFIAIYGVVIVLSQVYHTQGEPASPDSENRNKTHRDTFACFPAFIPLIKAGGPGQDPSCLDLWLVLIRVDKYMLS